MKRQDKVLIAVGVVFALVAMFLLFTFAPPGVPKAIERVTTSDPGLQDAIVKDRKMLPKFEGRLKHPDPGDRFAIKAMFKTPEGPEYLWLRDPVKTKQGFSAVVDQVPIAAQIQKGQHIDVPEENVVDWLIKRADGSLAGGATDLYLGRAAH